MDIGTLLPEAIGAGEPGWLADRRREAWALRRELPAPDRAQHRWRYVDPERLEAGDLPLVPFAPAGAAVVDPALAGVEVVRGTTESRIRLSPAAQAEGVVALDLRTAARDREGLVRELLGRLVEAGESRFAALNTALWDGGVFVHVPGGVRLDGPVLLRTETADAGLQLPRTLVVIGAGAEVMLVDESAGVSPAGTPLVHGVLELVAGDGSHVDVVTIQDLPAKATTAMTGHLRVGRDATVRQAFAAFGAGISKTDLVLDLAGRGARAEVMGIVLGGGRQQFDAHTVLRHAAPDTSSQLDVRVALAGKARSSATGLLYIGKEAVRTQAYQENRNLLLSETAHAVSIPELEILTDEVQAKHGATVGPIDEDQLYYLGSRGLAPADATAMIVGGFFEALLGRLPAGPLQDRIRERVSARLAHD